MHQFFTTLILFFTSTFAFAQEISGNWIGEIDINGNKLGFGFEIIKSQNQYESRLDIPKQGIKGFKATTTTFKDKQLSISFPEFQMNYEGILDEQGVIKGKMLQAGQGMPLELKKGTFTVSRPQAPKAPFNYQSETISFNTADGVSMAGTLTLPQQNEKYPLVILVSGSGPQDRDGAMFGHQFYYVLADHLSRNGIGVLRFDERGTGASEGDFHKATIESQAADIAVAVKYLKARKDIDASRLGLIGHSIGGIVAPEVATENKDIKFVVLMAAPGLNGDQLMLAQKAAFERTLGLSEMQILQGQGLVKHAYDIMVNTTLKQEQLQDSIAAFYVQKYGNLIPEDQRADLVTQLTGSEMISLIRSQPSVFLAKVKCPVLAINGSKDLQVLPKENLAAIEKALLKNGNKQVKIAELEALNHLFQECTTGLTDEYAEIEQTMSPQALNLISSWINELKIVN